MYKGSYNTNGDYTGFYVKELHQHIPEPNIELNEEQWQQALSKNYKVVNGLHTYSPYAQNQEENLESIRLKRDNLLLESDWTQLSDSPITEEKKLDWKIYRQQLRDVTINNNLVNIVWPTPPEE